MERARRNSRLPNYKTDEFKRTDTFLCLDFRLFPRFLSYLQQGKTCQITEQWSNFLLGSEQLTEHMHSLGYWMLPAPVSHWYILTLRKIHNCLK